MESDQPLISFSLLIVEDDKPVRDVMASLVPKKFPNCTIFTADNGIEGVELFQQFAPDIVLTDINMPAMEGFEMIANISSMNANASFIVLTAYAVKLTYEKFRDLNVSTYLLKPLDFSELFAAIEKCLAEKKSQPE